MKMDNHAFVCRLCINVNTTSDLRSIFEQEYDGKTLNHVIAECTGIKITKSDGLPMNICCMCFQTLQNTYDFRKQCYESDKKLRKQAIRNQPNVIKVKEESPEDQGKVFIKEVHENLPQNEEPLVRSNEIKTEQNPLKLLDNLDEIESLQNEEEKLINNAKQIDGLYCCQFCKTLLSNRKTFIIHLRRHTGHKLKYCDKCGEGFSKNKQLDDHILVCSSKTSNTTHLADDTKRQIPETFTLSKLWSINNGPLKCRCMICDKIFDRISLIRNHLKYHASNQESFETLNLLRKPYLFDSVHIDGDKVEESIKTIENHIKRMIEANTVSNFYQINNKYGFELTLSDSESEEGDDNRYNKSYGYDCSLCPQSFHRKYEIIEHMSEHKQTLYDRCNYCSTYFPNEILLKHHLRTQCENKEKIFNCNLCNVRFMWQSSYGRHKKFHQDLNNALRNSPSSQLSCEYCFKTFKRKHNLKNHIKIHMNKSFICAICLKPFTDTKALFRHTETHRRTDYTCDFCSKKFTRKDCLKLHLRTHVTNRKPAEPKLCVYCGKGFSSSSNLTTHIRRHTGELPYKCEFCGKGFPRSSDLRYHRRSHTGEKPCICTICGKGFSRSSRLTCHMRVHTGERPHKCPYCDRAFTQSHDLVLHIRRHNGEKPFACGICGERFIQGTALTNHRRALNHHEDIQLKRRVYNSVERLEDIRS